MHVGLRSTCGRRPKVQSVVAVPHVTIGSSLSPQNRGTSLNSPSLLYTLILEQTAMQRLPNIVPTHVRGLATAVSRSPLSGLNAVARTKAEQITAEWKGTNASGETVKNYIGGKFVDSKSEQWIDLLDPVRPHRPSCRRRADGCSYSRRRPCFLVSQRRPPLSSSRQLKPPRRRLRPGVALPFLHDNDSPSSMPSRLSLSPGGY